MRFSCPTGSRKGIKAYLVRHQIEFRKTHDLSELVDLVKDKDEILSSKLRFSDWLTDFAVEFRYPGAPPVGKESAMKALEDSQKVKEIIMNALADYLAKGRP